MAVHIAKVIVKVEVPPDLYDRLDTIKALLLVNNDVLEQVMADFTELKDEVQQSTAVGAAAVALLNGIADRIDAAIAADDLEDQSEVAQLAAELRAQTQGLAQAVETNTPAAPAAPAEPAPAEAPAEAPPTDQTPVEPALPVDPNGDPNAV